MEKMENANRHHGERERFFGAAKLVAGLTMASRVLGLMRDMVIVPLGCPAMSDAFWTAFSIPNFFRRLFGEGALSAAFIPVFTDVSEKHGWDRARVVLANVAASLALLLGSILLVGELGLLIGWMFCPGDWITSRLLEFTAVMLPFMFTVCMLALGSAALNCKGHFGYPAAAPIMLNVGLIASAYFIAPALSDTDQGRFLVIAWGLTITGVLQLVALVWLLRRAKLLAVPRLRPMLSETRAIAARMLPMLIPLSILQFSALADRLIALGFTATEQYPNFPLSAGVVRCLYAANRVSQLPMGVLAISVATAVFPLFARYSARGDTLALTDVTNRALRLCLFFALPATAGLIILAEPIMTVLFGRKDFTPFDVQRAALILQMYSLGMVGFFCNHILLRVFFARKETSAPLRIACTLAVINCLLVVGGIFTPLKSGAMGLATAITATANTIALTIVLRRRLGRLGLGKIFVSTLRISAAVILMATIVWATRYFVADATEQWSRTLSSGMITAVGIVAGGITYFGSAFFLRCGELTEMLASLRNRRQDER